MDPAAGAGAEGVSVACAPGGYCLTVGGGPDVLIARDGVWDQPQPLDLSALGPASASLDMAACKVRNIPGTRGTNVGYATTTALSCPAPGACTLGGLIGGAGAAVPFTATQRHGTWSRPRTIPGMAVIDPRKQATIGALSCPAPGQCAAGGLITQPIFYDHAYLATETGGRWGKAFLVPGITTLEQKHGNSRLTVITCWAPAHCIAGGYYDAVQSPGFQPFLTGVG